MLDIAWPELMVIGAVALVAIPPKDLPKVMHALGKWVGKARAFAHEIQRTFDQLSYESEIADKLKKEEAAKAASPDPTPSPSTETPIESGHDNRTTP